MSTVQLSYLPVNSRKAPTDTHMDMTERGNGIWTFTKRSKIYNKKINKN